MSFDFAAVLSQMAEVRGVRRAPDPGLPACDARARPDRPGRRLRALTPQDTREIVYSLLNDAQRKQFENDLQLDFAYAIPSVARLPRQLLLPARRDLGRLPPDPAARSSRSTSSACRTSSRSSAASHAASCSSPGPPAPGKSTTLAVDGRPDQPEREEHILTIEDPIEFLHSHKKCIVNQREVGSRRDRLRGGAEVGAARGPRRDPRRRDARPGDDLDRADRGRDRAPRVRHAAHAVDRADGGPHHRRLPAAPAAAGADAALDRPAGHRHPAAPADRRRLLARRRDRGAWCRRRRSAT